MHNQPDTLFGEHALDTFEFEVGGALKLAGEMERAHAIARGIEATIRLVRASTVRREIEHSSFIGPEDEDALLALAGQAAGMLAERAEHLSDWASSVPRPETVRATDVPRSKLKSDAKKRDGGRFAAVPFDVLQCPCAGKSAAREENKRH